MKNDIRASTAHNRAQFEHLAELLGQPRFKIEWHMRRFFGPCLSMLKGARVLDVGCGRGITTFCAAFFGANEVVGLEPEAAGGQHGSSQDFIRIRDALGLGQCVCEPTDFMSYRPETGFDFVLLYNSINHIREVTSDVRRDPVARQSQSKVIAQIARMLKPNGWVILCDCSRRSLFGDLHLRCPFRGRIEWKKHQTPGAWRQLLAEEGFGDFCHNWYVPYIAPWTGWLLDNMVSNYLTFSHFVLRGRKIR